MPDFKRFSAFVATLTLREKVLALVALMGVIAFAIEFGLVRPSKAEAIQLRARLAQQSTESQALEQAVRAISTRAASADPLARQRAERDELRRVVAQTDSLMARASVEVRMGEIIRGLLSASPGLTLVSLRTLPSELFFKGTGNANAGGAAALLAPAGAPAVAAASAPRPGASAPLPVAPLPALYKHGVEVTVQGPYLRLLPYLQSLESNANGVFWSNLKLDVARHPDMTLAITLHTLSVQPGLSLD